MVFLWFSYGFPTIEASPLEKSTEFDSSRHTSLHGKARLAPGKWGCCGRKTMGKP